MRTSDEEDGSHAGGSSRRSHGWWGLLPSSAAEASPPQVNRGSSSHPTFILGKRRAWLHLLCEAPLKTITRVPPQPPPFHVKQSRLAHPLTGLVTPCQPLPVRRGAKQDAVLDAASRARWRSRTCWPRSCWCPRQHRRTLLLTQAPLSSSVAETFPPDLLFLLLQPHRRGTGPSSPHFPVHPHPQGSRRPRQPHHHNPAPTHRHFQLPLPVRVKRKALR